MSDGKVQLVGGKVLVSAAGKVATADDCCCGDVCVECTGTDYVATITHSGGGTCWTPEGTAILSSTYDHGPCGCEWFGDVTFPTNGWVLCIGYCSETKTFCAVLVVNVAGPTYGANDDTCLCWASCIQRVVTKATDITGLVSCVNGRLTGTFTLNGDGACAPDVATVVLS